MDWIDTFQRQFKDHTELTNLNRDKFTGKLELNFSSGVVLNVNFNQHLKAQYRAPVTVTEYGTDNKTTS